jgi:hypothetical protein
MSGTPSPHTNEGRDRMDHPLLSEFCRASGQLRPEFFRRCQRVFRDEIAPMLTEVETLREENATLKQQLEALQAKAAKRKAEVQA